MVLINLPLEDLLYICSYLDFLAITRLSQVSTFFYRLEKEDNFWKSYTPSLNYQDKLVPDNWSHRRKYCAFLAKKHITGEISFFPLAINFYDIVFLLEVAIRHDNYPLYHYYMEKYQRQHKLMYTGQIVVHKRLLYSLVYYLPSTFNIIELLNILLKHYFAVNEPSVDIFVQMVRFEKGWEIRDQLHILMHRYVQKNYIAANIDLYNAPRLREWLPLYNPREINSLLTDHSVQRYTDAILAGDDDQLRVLVTRDSIHSREGAAIIIAAIRMGRKDLLGLVRSYINTFPDNISHLYEIYNTLDTKKWVGDNNSSAYRVARW